MLHFSLRTNIKRRYCTLLLINTSIEGHGKMHPCLAWLTVLVSNTYFVQSSFSIFDTLNIYIYLSIYSILFHAF